MYKSHSKLEGKVNDSYASKIGRSVRNYATAVGLTIASLLPNFGSVANYNAARIAPVAAAPAVALLASGCGGGSGGGAVTPTPTPTVTPTPTPTPTPIPRYKFEAYFFVWNPTMGSIVSYKTTGTDDDRMTFETTFGDSSGNLATGTTAVTSAPVGHPMHTDPDTATLTDRLKNTPDGQEIANRAGLGAIMLDGDYVNGELDEALVNVEEE